MKLLANKVAIVTGAASGIGAASAELFAEHGASVLVTDINEEAGQATTEQIAAKYPDVRFQKVDATSDADMQEMCVVAEKAFGGVDILMNNAATIILGRITDLSPEEWDLSMACAIKPYFLGTRHAIPYLRKRGGGSIVNTASVAGLTANHGMVAHNTCKAAVLGFTRNAAIDYAQYGIRVNAICPGGTASPPMKVMLSQLSETAKLLEEGIPMRRLAEPIEQAKVALFLASDLASYVTGVSLPVDGGLTAFSGDTVRWNVLFGRGEDD